MAMKLSTLFALGLSVVSSVSLVIVNKYLISSLMFPYVTTLTAAHLFITAGVMEAACKCGKLFEEKGVEPRPRVQFSVINGLSVGFLNLSLAFNSVGFYQMTKLAIIPFTVTLQTLFYARVFSTRIKATLAVLLGGVGVATINDVELNPLGTLVSVAAVGLTCVAQIWTGTMQKTHGVSSTQLLHVSAPLMAVVLLVFGVPLDRALMTPAGELFVFDLRACLFVAASCAIAVLVNFSTFLVIGKCDAVTYQVLGHLKTMLVLCLGFAVLHNPYNGRSIAGIGLAMLGMVLYAHEETRAGAAAAAVAEKELAASHGGEKGHPEKGAEEEA